MVMVVAMLCELATLGNLEHMGSNGHFPWWYPLLQWLVLAGYFSISWLRGGQTLGMRPWRMTLVSADDEAVTLRIAARRIVVVSLPILLLAMAPFSSATVAGSASLCGWLVLFAPIFVDRRRRALHDIIAGTVLARRRSSRQP